jgi:hypothetical protein
MSNCLRLLLVLLCVSIGFIDILVSAKPSGLRKHVAYLRNIRRLFTRLQLTPNTGDTDPADGATVFAAKKQEYECEKASDGDTRDSSRAENWFCHNEWNFPSNCRVDAVEESLIQGVREWDHRRVLWTLVVIGRRV